MRAIQRRRKSRLRLRRSRYAYAWARFTASLAVLNRRPRAPKYPLACFRTFFRRRLEATLFFARGMSYFIPKARLTLLLSAAETGRFCRNSLFRLVDRLRSIWVPYAFCRFRLEPPRLLKRLPEDLWVLSLGICGVRRLGKFIEYRGLPPTRQGSWGYFSRVTLCMRSKPATRNWIT